MCSVTDCSRDAVARGWCLMHYKRWRKHGDPSTTVRASPRQTPDERLRRVGWTVDVAGCWRWSGNINRGGYGTLDIFGSNQSAHRIAYEAWVGPIPEGLSVRHRCDVRDCINPEHLELGTHQENMQDMVLRGRAPSAKLTWDQVREIRASSEVHRVLAERYGVAGSQISMIQNNKTWKIDSPQVAA